MMVPTVLVRVRLNRAQIERLDEFAAKLGAELKRRVTRAAVIRAFVTLGLTWAITPEIVDAIKADTVRRGFPAGKASAEEGVMSATAKRQPKPKRPKLAALFLLGTDGEMYAACPWPEGVPRLGAGAVALLAVRLDKTERALMLDTIHTEGVIEAARTLAGILRPDA